MFFLTFSRFCAKCTIFRIDFDGNDSEIHEFGKFEVLDELRKDLQAIQMGEKPDAHGWMEEVEV